MEINRAYFVKKIQDEDATYRFWRPFVDWMFRRSYRRIQYVGRENVPADGAVIFAPNHVNALNDAMAVLGIDSRPKVFAARADIFNNPKRARLLRFFKILPIRRMRDGAQEVLHNDSTEREAIDAMQSDVPFVILPEGTHRTKHSLLPLKKGIFRIALRANDEFGDKRPVYIVPVGLEYGNYFHLWDNLTVNIGQPINVTEFVRNHSDLDRGHMILALREELTHRMQQQILWVPDDEHYEQNWQRLKQNPPQPFTTMKHHRLPKWLLIILLILTSPLFIISAAVTAPLWLILLLTRIVIRDPAFYNSVQYVVQLVALPATLFLQAPFWIFFQEYGFQLRLLKEK